MYDKVAEYLTLLGRTELLTCSAAQVSYTKIRDQSQTVGRGVWWRECRMVERAEKGQGADSGGREEWWGDGRVLVEWWRECSYIEK